MGNIRLAEMGALVVVGAKAISLISAQKTRVLKNSKRR
jgi:hypothetical protein